MVKLLIKYIHLAGREKTSTNNTYEGKKIQFNTISTTTTTTAATTIKQKKIEQFLFYNSHIEKSSLSNRTATN